MRQALTILISVCLCSLYVFLSGCCGCGTGSKQRYNPDDVTCIVLNDTRILAYNNEDSTERAIYDDEPVYGDALILRVSLKKSTQLCYKKPETNILFPSAYATTCKYIDVGPVKYIDSIVHYYISTDKAYDDRNPAGADINEFFLMPDAAELNTESVVDIIGIKRPAKSGKYVFTVNIQLADGSYREAYTSPINVEH